MGPDGVSEITANSWRRTKHFLHKQRKCCADSKGIVYCRINWFHDLLRESKVNWEWCKGTEKIKTVEKKATDN